MKINILVVFCLLLNFGSAFGSIQEEWQERTPQIFVDSDTKEVLPELSCGIKVFYHYDDSEKQLTVDLLPTLCTTDEPLQKVVNKIWSWGCGGRLDLSTNNLRLILATLSETKFPCETSTTGLDTWGTVGRWLKYYGNTKKVHDKEASSNDGEFVAFKELFKTPAELDTQILSDLKERFLDIKKVYLSSDYRVQLEMTQEGVEFSKVLKEQDITLLKNRKRVSKNKSE